MSDKRCPLGDDCDMTIAWMLGRETAKDDIAARDARIEELEAKNVRLETEAKLADAMRHVMQYSNDPHLRAMNDYRIEAATKEEWARRAFAAETALYEALNQLDIARQKTGE